MRKSRAAELQPVITDETPLGPKDVAGLIGASVWTARRRMTDGDIASWREGILLRCTRASVEEYLARCREQMERELRAA